MNHKRYLYGSLGFLSLLGFIGVFTDQRYFLGFFAFAVDFEYFFAAGDEMLDEWMNRAAARAFYCGMLAVAAATLVSFFMLGKAGDEALMRGFAIGWMVSVLVHSGMSGYYGLQENGMATMIETRIKELRAKHGMRQEELARLVGVRRETIGNLEKGRYNPSLVLAWKIAHVFDVSIEEVFTVKETDAEQK